MTFEIVRRRHQNAFAEADAAQDNLLRAWPAIRHRKIEIFVDEIDAAAVVDVVQHEVHEHVRMRVLKLHDDPMQMAGSNARRRMNAQQALDASHVAAHPFDCRIDRGKGDMARFIKSQSMRGRADRT
jgi:hypothetical protein